jgi:hypothetical protein
MGKGINITEFIPPADYAHRNGFSNHSLIDKLDGLEKKQLEKELITLLIDEPHTDDLVVETLTYLKSTESVPLFYIALDKEMHPVAKIIIATCIYELNSDNGMIPIVLEAVLKTEKYGLILAFYYLAKFKNPGVDEFINRYINHPDFLLSYNAKRALALRSSNQI